VICPRAIFPPSPSPGNPGEGRGEGSRGFTLIELLIVIALIAILISLLLPTISRAKEQSRTVACLSNLRQLATLAHIYCDSHKGSYPISQYRSFHSPNLIHHNWDFTTTRHSSTGQTTISPGLLWSGQSTPKIHHCPSFDGRSNTPADPFTGYNYNTSYIGHGQGENIVASAKVSQVRRPSRCALFGDGQYAAGANKFMRSPFPSPGDVGLSLRSAGTQGFRHGGRTNVAFADGHAESLGTRHTETLTSEKLNLTATTGFLSADNSLYATD